MSEVGHSVLPVAGELGRFPPMLCVGISPDLVMVARGHLDRRLFRVCSVAVVAQGHSQQLGEMVLNELDDDDVQHSWVVETADHDDQGVGGHHLEFVDDLEHLDADAVPVTVLDLRGDDDGDAPG